MTDKQYGTYQTPSSRPPEPPYRSGSQETQAGAPAQTGERASSDNLFIQQQPAPEHDPSGFGEAGTVSTAVSREAQSQSAYQSQSGSAATESFEAARFGDTQTMPHAAHEKLSDYSSTARQPYSGASNGVHMASPTAASAGAGAGARAVSAAPARKSGSAGKTFLFGFLGALLACAIAFGGFIAWSGVNASGVESGAGSINMGAANSSVINAADEGQTLAEAVAAKALPSVVAVYNYQEQTSSYGIGFSASTSGELSASGMGSGVVISDDGYILTNYHVIEDASQIKVKVGDAERDATYVGGDESSDIAVIKVEDTEGLEAADIGDSDDLVIGEWVMTVGAPLGLEQSVATGVVSATNRSTTMTDSGSDLYSYYGTSTPEYTYYPNMIQTDAVINPGNSGGALVDADGKLIGINTMISSYSGDYAGVGFAIPVNYAMGIAQQVIDGKEPTHAILGVSISSVNSSNAKRYGLKATSGAYIASIADGTGAADSDLQVGDIITAIDGKSVSSASDVTLDVREHNPGDTVTVTVNRDGETKDVEVKLSSDENIANSQNSQSAPGTGSGSGNSGSSGNGQGRSYDMEQLEELLKMLGM